MENTYSSILKEKLPLKIKPEHITRDLELIANSYRGRSKILLHDDNALAEHFADFDPLDCRDPENLIRIKSLNLDDFIFVYACQFDDIGYPFALQICKNGGKIHPAWCFIPSLYFHLNNKAYLAFKDELIRQCEGDYAKWNTPDFSNLVQALDMTSDLSGCYLEIGCYRGSSGGAVLAYLNKINASIETYFLDVFEGFTYDEVQSAPDEFWKGSHRTEGRDVVNERLIIYETGELKVNVHKANIITDALPEKIDSIRVANIDVDLYEAILASLDKVAPLMEKGGVMICEDPGHTPRLIGARVAIWQWLEESPLAKDFICLHMESGQNFLIRK